MGVPLEAPVEPHGILEGHLHHTQVCRSALSNLGFFCACRADGKGRGCKYQTSSACKGKAAADGVLHEGLPNQGECRVPQSCRSVRCLWSVVAPPQANTQQKPQASGRLGVVGRGPWLPHFCHGCSGDAASRVHHSHKRIGKRHEPPGASAWGLFVTTAAAPASTPAGSGSPTVWWR